MVTHNILAEPELNGTRHGKYVTYTIPDLLGTYENKEMLKGDYPLLPSIFICCPFTEIGFGKLNMAPSSCTSEKA